MAKNYITPSGLENLKTELRHLVKEERPKTVDVVAWAAGNGDRSENGDYIYGKKKLREIDRRVRFLTKKIENAEVVDPKQQQDQDRVLFGAQVKVEFEDESQAIYQIVGEDEFQAEQGKVSWKSPLARAILGKKRGDEVFLKRPKGDTWLEILEIHYK